MNYIAGVASVINDSPSSIELQLRGLIRDIIEDAACIEFTKVVETKLLLTSSLL